MWAEAEYRIRSTLAKKPQGLTPLCTFDKLHALWLTNLVLLTHDTQEVAKDSLELRRLIRMIHTVSEVCLFLEICQAHGAENLEELWPRELWLAFGVVAPNEPELPRETV